MPELNLRVWEPLRCAEGEARLTKDPNRLYNYSENDVRADCTKELARVSGETSEIYSYQSAKIKNSALTSYHFYETAIHKFLGNSVIKRLEERHFRSDEEIRARLKPVCWEHANGVDVSGLIAPKSEIETRWKI